MHTAYRNLIVTIVGGFTLIFFNSAVQDYAPGGLLLFTETLLLVVYWFPSFNLKKELKNAYNRFRSAYK